MLLVHISYVFILPTMLSYVQVLSLTNKLHTYNYKTQEGGKVHCTTYNIQVCLLTLKN